MHTTDELSVLVLPILSGSILNVYQIKDSAWVCRANDGGGALERHLNITLCHVIDIM